MSPDYLYTSGKVRIPVPALRIIENDHKVGTGSARDPLLDILPRRQQIAQTDGREIACDRRSKNASCRICRGDARDYLYLGACPRISIPAVICIRIRAILFCDLQHDSSHSIDSGVTSAYDGYGISPGC